MKAIIINNGSQENLDEITATPADVRVGKLSIDQEGDLFEGEIEDIQEATAGIINWTGTNTPSIRYPGTAEPAHILLGKTAWVNDNLIEGIMPIIQVSDVTLDAGEEYTIPEGYHDGTGKVLTSSLADQTPGTASESQILINEIAYVNGNRITGTMPSLTDNTSINLTSDNPTKVIPCTHAYYRTNSDGTDRLCFLYQGDNGHIRGNGVTLFAADTSLMTASETAGGLVASSILSGKSIFGLSGTATNDAIAEAGHILESNTAYVKGSKITGTMTHLSNRATVKFSSSNSTPVVLGDACYLATNTDNIERAMIRVNPGGFIASGAVVGVKKTDMLTNVTNDSTLTNASYLLEGQTAYSKGTKYAGTMKNVSAYEYAHGVTYDESRCYLQMTNGAHITNGTGGYPTVSCPIENKTITPTVNAQQVLAASGKVIRQVTVNPIPSNYYQVIPLNYSISLDTSTTSKDFSFNIGYTESQILGISVRLYCNGNSETSSIVETIWETGFLDKTVNGYIHMVTNFFGHSIIFLNSALNGTTFSGQATLLMGSSGGGKKNRVDFINVVLKR